jgi:hypothetical protein
MVECLLQSDLSVEEWSKRNNIESPPLYKRVMLSVNRKVIHYGEQGLQVRKRRQEAG